MIKNLWTDLQINKLELFKLSKELFDQSFDASVDLDINRQVKCNVDPFIKPIAASARFDNIKVNSSSIEVNNIKIDNVFFNDIDKSTIKGILFFGVTVGNLNTRSFGPITDLAIDYYKTSLVNSLLIMLKKDLIDSLNIEKMYSSNGFGPGYFNAPMDQFIQIDQLVGLSSLNISYDGLSLIPQKSSVGYFFILDKPYKSTKVECTNCLGNKGGCEFCNINYMNHQSQI